MAGEVVRAGFPNLFGRPRSAGARTRLLPSTTPPERSRSRPTHDCGRPLGGATLAEVVPPALSGSTVLSVSSLGAQVKYLLGKISRGERSVIQELS